MMGAMNEETEEPDMFRNLKAWWLCDFVSMLENLLLFHLEIKLYNFQALPIHFCHFKKNYSWYKT